MSCGRSLLLLGLAFGACNSTDPQAMTPTPAQRQPDDFPARIGYPAATKGAADSVVVLDWDRVAELVPAAGPATADRTVVQADSGLGIRFLKVPLAEHRLDIDIYAATSAAEAQRQLVAVASMTMMRVNPYEKGPPLGDLCCRLPAALGRSRLLWANANLFVSVRGDGCLPESMLGVAEALDRRLSASLVEAAVAEGSAPQLLDLVAAPSANKVGAPVSVTWRIRGELPAVSGAVVRDAEARGVTITDAGPTSLQFVCERPGELVVDVAAVFPRWLVLRRDSLRVVISP